MENSVDIRDLQAAFPYVEPRVVLTIFESCGNDFLRTYSALLSMTQDTFGFALLDRQPPEPSTAALVEAAEDGENDNGGEGATGTAGPLVRRTHTSPQRSTMIPMRIMSDRELIKDWAKVDRTLLPEFAELARAVCFVPELMRTSQLDAKIAILQTKINNRQQGDFSCVAACLVKRAFGTCLWSLQWARAYSGSDPGRLAEGNFYRGCMQVYRDLELWQKPLLKAAVNEMIATADKDSLQITCGLRLRASRECMARKQHAFAAVIDRSITGIADNDTNVQPHGQDTTNLEACKRKLFVAAKSVVDEMKDMAFRSAFTEPTKFYFRAVRDGTMEGDVEVHGSNTYLAVLLASMGVKLTRTPLLRDDIKGIVPFKDGLKDEDLDRLWATENIGKSWEVVAGRGTRPSFSQRVWHNHNRFFFSGSTPREVAENCLLLQDSPDRGRLYGKLLPYLRAFVSFFSEEVAVERLCKSFLATDSLEPSLNAVFRAVATEDEFKEANKEARRWLWDLMTGAFHRDRALALLQCAGICPTSATVG